MNYTNQLIAGDSATLAKPEFEGMWNKFERYVVPKEVVVDVIKGSKVSKMDQDIMREKLQLQRENIVQTQVAAGREFKGKSSFNSKPTVVHFKVSFLYIIVEDVVAFVNALYLESDISLLSNFLPTGWSGSLPCFACLSILMYGTQDSIL